MGGEREGGEKEEEKKDGRLQGVGHNCFLIFNLSSWLYLLYHQWSSERAKRLRQLDRANMAITNFDGAAKRDSGWEGGERGGVTEQKINKREVLIQSFCENHTKWGLFAKA